MDTILSPSSAAGIDPGSSAVLARLLAEAFEALDVDLSRARASLSRAVALVGVATSTADGARLAPWQVRKISALIEARLESGVRTSELAAIAGLSISHFTRVFRAHYGRSPKQYVLERRIGRAQRMMLDGSVRISDVAPACGFSDQAHLCRTFRRLVGASPRAWRQACSSPR